MSVFNGVTLHNAISQMTKLMTISICSVFFSWLLRNDTFILNQLSLVSTVKYKPGLSNLNQLRAAHLSVRS